MAEKKGDQQEEGEGRMGKRREVAQRGAREYPFGSVLVRDGDNENNQGEAMQASLM